MNNDFTQDELEDLGLCVASYMNQYDDMVFPDLYQKIHSKLEKLKEYHEGFEGNKGLLG